MSVCLRILDGGQDFDDIEVWAPDYCKAYLWFWTKDGEERINLNRERLAQLRDLLNDIL